MKIIVLPRAAVPRYCDYFKAETPHAVISLQDPDSDWEVPHHAGQLGVCKSWFLDFDTLRHKDKLYGIVPYPNLEYHGKTLAEWSMQAHHADSIAKFVGKMLDAGAEVFVVHCENGVHRSPSVAMAMADAMGWGRECVGWVSPHSEPPNQHVYQLTKTALLVVGQFEIGRYSSAYPDGRIDKGSGCGIIVGGRKKILARPRIPCEERWFEVMSRSYLLQFPALSFALHSLQSSPVDGFVGLSS